jgi:hypothetical protein
MNIHSLIKDVSFDDQAMRAMGEAYDRACDSLGTFGAAVTVREIMAKRIIEAAKMGERDPSRLYRHALNELGVNETTATQLAARAKPPLVRASIARTA